MSHHRPITSGAETTELLDYVGAPVLSELSLSDAYFHAHIYYSRRSAIALATNDLEQAMRCARIALEALLCQRKHEQATGTVRAVSSGPF